MILMHISLSISSEVQNTHICGSYQMLHINHNINIPPLLLRAISYRQSETILSCSHLVFTIYAHGFSNRLTHCWLLTSYLLRPCIRAIKNRVRLMFGRTLFYSISSLNLNACSESICTSHSNRLLKLNKLLSRHIGRQIDWLRPPRLDITRSIAINQSCLAEISADKI